MINHLKKYKHSLSGYLPTKRSLAGIGLLLSLTCFAQKDSVKTRVINSSICDSSDVKHLSIKGDFFISGGVGLSIISEQVYGFSIITSGPEFSAYSESESPVYNCSLDYGIMDDCTVGVCFAYQTISGIAYNDGGLGRGILTDPESITRWNVSARILQDITCTRQIEIYFGARVGVSVWKDIVTGSPPYPSPTHLNDITISLQFPFGIRVFKGPFFLQAEAAIGSPYFAEAGIGFKINTKR